MFKLKSLHFKIHLNLLRARAGTVFYSILRINGLSTVLASNCKLLGSIFVKRKCTLYMLYMFLLKKFVISF